MKPGRQTTILEIIESQNIETQNQLLDALAERGIRTTQATLSRDIKDMRLIKEQRTDGRAHYVRPPESAQTHDSRLQKILKESVLSMDLAQNILVIKTLSGLASGACSAIDSIHIDGLVGTLAGDDTAFLAMRSNAGAQAFCQEIEAML